SGATEIPIDLSSHADELAADAPATSPVDALEPPERTSTEAELAPTVVLNEAPVRRSRKKKHAPKAPEDAREARPSAPVPRELVDAGADAGQPGSETAVADSGGSSIELVIHAAKLREHAVGARLLPIVASVEAWRDLFRSARIDPATGVDRIVVHGADLRDSR